MTSDLQGGLRAASALCPPRELLRPGQKAKEIQQRVWRDGNTVIRGKLLKESGSG